MSLKMKNALSAIKQSLLTGMLMMLMTSVHAADLNICAGKDELPFSNQNQEGFENDIAKVIASALGRNVNFVWWSDARYTVSEFLDKKKCDVMLGVDESDPRVLKTVPY